MELARSVTVHAYGMGTRPLGDLAAQQCIAGLAPSHCHDLPQHQLHQRLGGHRAYLHPYRWTSLGLALIEAMTLGMPVLALSTTEAPEAVPPSAGVVTNRVGLLRDTAKRWLADRDEARERGEAARRHALEHYGLDRFLSDWDRTLMEVT
jgi:glycosyltransferase involved in cell wall biosynthesis